MFVNNGSIKGGGWTEHPESTYGGGILAGLARVSLGLGGGLLDRSLLGSGSLLGSSLGGSLGSSLILQLARNIGIHAR